MSSRFTKIPGLGLALAAAFPFNLLAQETLDPVVVTAPPMSAPLEVSFDPRAPQQPLPANDGASLLKTVPGMNVIRKGGTDGDPMFRGMAASRLNILLDGEQILGGCGMRMDPPTAYVFPDSYDRVTLLKGPQSVTHGPGASAGTVLFERQPTYFSEPGWQVKGAVTGALFAFLSPVYAAATGILPIRACHSFGPVVWTEVPWASTATVTGMSFTSNS